MARAIWTGAVSFGLVNVPVGLYSATEDHDVHFHQFEEGTSSRVRNQRVNEDTGDEVAYEDVVKGADIGDGEYVMLTQEELESVEPGRSRTIDISDFVDAAEIDPIHYQKSYYLAPSDDSAKKPYSLLVKAMEKAGRIGIATFVMRGKQYLAAIRPSGNVLVLETMFFADEVRDPAKEIDRLPAAGRVAGKDLDMAVNLIKAMTSPWKPKNYRDTYTERVEKLIDAKRKNREIVVPEDTEESAAKVGDLLTALQESLESAKGHKPGNTRHLTRLQTRKAGQDADRDDDRDDGKTTAKKTARKKTAAKKSARKSTAKRTSASKTSASRTGASRTGAKKTGAKKTGAKKTGAKKTGAKKTGAKKTGAKKTARKSTGGSGRRKAS
jgi:DNA end-binding protein Ku